MRVHCTNDDCNAQTEPTCDGYEPSAIEVWNRRAPQPVARVPLTEERIMDISRAEFLDPRWPSTPIAIARAIERAHGMGSNDVPAAIRGDERKV